MRVSRRLFASLSSLLTALALDLAATPAEAFCRTHTCQADASCVTDESGCPVGGSALFWPRACISYSVHADGSKVRSISAADAESVLDTAYASWTTVACDDDRGPSIDVFRFDRVQCDRIEFNQCDDNANIWVFRDEEWPYEDGGLTLAQTWVHFDTRTGEIFDADVEVNTADFAITTSDDEGRSQFIAIATHEIGHVFGMDHATDQRATMYASYNRLSNMAELTPDDIEGFCTIYPPNRVVGRCDPDPYNGFSATCGDTTCDEGGCHATRPGGGTLGAWGIVVAGLGITLMRLRRRLGRRAAKV